FIAVQAVLWKEGMFGSAGLTRYLISIMPFLIILALVGLSLIKLNFRTKLFLGSLIIFSQVSILLVNILGAGPIESKWIKLDSDYIAAGIWIRDNINKNQFLYADHPEIIYYSARDLNSSALF